MVFNLFGSTDHLNSSDLSEDQYPPHCVTHRASTNWQSNYYNTRQQMYHR